MVSMVDQMVDQNATYLTKRRGVHYYDTRRIPKELQKRLGKERIVVSLKTKSRRMAVFSGTWGHHLFTSYVTAGINFLNSFACKL